MSDDGLLSIGEVNELDLDQFLWLFENVIEKTSEAASYVHTNRPFKDIVHISKLFNKYLDMLSIEDQEDILRKLPDLGVKAKMTEEFSREQENVGIYELNDEDYETLHENNYKHREKFGFPFVICIQENTITTIFEMMQIRLENEKLTELKIGINEMKKIGKHRLFKLVWHD